MLINFSCDSYLDKQPPAVLAGDILLDENGINGLLLGAYNQMVGGGIFGSAMGSDWTYASGASDDMYKGSEQADQNNYNDVERWTVIPANGYMTERWRDCYNGVARSNYTLEFLEMCQAGSKPIAAQRATQIEAEAKFLRAWFHFSANTVFAKIPYVTTSGIEGREIPNTDAGWSGIEEDLRFAIANLPTSWPAARRGAVTSWGAKGLLAKAFMYQNKLSEAKPILDDIINNGGFELVEKYWDNYDEDTENNKESIFELQCSAGSTFTNSLRLTIAVGIGSGVGPAAVGTWGFYQPSQSLVNCFGVDDDGLPFIYTDPKTAYTQRPGVKDDRAFLSTDPFTPHDGLLDPRLDHTVARRGVDFLGWGIFAGQSWIRHVGNGGPYMSKKFFQKVTSHGRLPGDKTYNDRNFRYLRLAHVLLWRAEIAVEENDLGKATELVNLVRARAANPDGFVMGKVTATIIPNDGKVDTDWTQPAANYKIGLYPTFTNQAYAREAVRMEIRLEFASEGQRFFDLRRWGQGTATPNYDIDVLNAYVADDTKYRGFMGGAVFNAGKRYMPIPETQIDLQKGVLTQDPNY